MNTARFTVQVYVNATDPDSAVLALLDHASVTGWEVESTRTYRLDLGRDGDESRRDIVADSQARLGRLVLALDTSSGPNLYHIEAVMRDVRPSQFDALTDSVTTDSWFRS